MPARNPPPLPARHGTRLLPHRSPERPQAKPRSACIRRRPASIGYGPFGVERTQLDKSAPTVSARASARLVRRSRRLGSTPVVGRLQLDRPHLGLTARIAEYRVAVDVTTEPDALTFRAHCQPIRTPTSRIRGGWQLPGVLKDVFELGELSLNDLPTLPVNQWSHELHPPSRVHLHLEINAGTGPLCRKAHRSGGTHGTTENFPSKDARTLICTHAPLGRVDPGTDLACPATSGPYGRWALSGHTLQVVLPLWMAVELCRVVEDLFD